MDNNRIAIFIDAENVTNWLKKGGAELLLEELSAIGQTVVRRAYGIWTNLLPFQTGLNRLGFELIHSFHPVKGKNSTDIQMTVDIMEYVWRVENINWFVLATGDSDFSPLFRRLREMGKEVIGVGPRSALSESVKSSCTRFIYTNSVIPVKEETEKNEKIQAAFDDAAELVEKVLNSVESPTPCSLLKSRMQNLDSAFDEKTLGFKSFTKFLQKLDGISVYYDDDAKTWLVSVTDGNETQNTNNEYTNAENVHSPDIAHTHTQEDIYRRLLRKKQWHTIPKETLIRIHHQCVNIGKMHKVELAEKILEQLNDDTTPSDIKKALALFYKARLITIEKKDDEDNPLWTINSIPINDLLITIDKAMLQRLIKPCIDKNIPINPVSVKNLFFSSINTSMVKSLINDAK
jgi:uncharacterized protein (TIGR00288 family)